MKLNLKNLNKDQFVKIIMIILIALFIALLSGLNTVATMPKTVKVEKYQLTRQEISLKNSVNKGYYPVKIRNLCDEIFIQEVNNVKVGHQNIDGVIGLLANSDCDFTYQQVADAIGFDDGLLCPVKLREEYGRDCINHLNDWKPGDLNKEGNAQEMPVLTSAESHQRFIELCEKYDLPADVIWHTENYYGLKEGTILCIAIAETSGGKNGYGKPGCWNVGNVGNTDNPNNRRCFANLGAGLAAIGSTLNNSYLGNNQTISCLNGAGDCIEQNATQKRYSTGKSGNRERNMIGCFYSIYQEKINPQTFNLHNR